MWSNKKQRKQNLESAQYGLEIGLTWLNWTEQSKGEAFFTAYKH